MPNLCYLSAGHSGNSTNIVKCIKTLICLIAMAQIRMHHCHYISQTKCLNLREDFYSGYLGQNNKMSNGKRSR